MDVACLARVGVKETTADAQTTHIPVISEALSTLYPVLHVEALNIVCNDLFLARNPQDMHQRFKLLKSCGITN